MIGPSGSYWFFLGKYRFQAPGTSPIAFGLPPGVTSPDSTVLVAYGRTRYRLPYSASVAGLPPLDWEVVFEVLGTGAFLTLEARDGSTVEKGRTVVALPVPGRIALPDPVSDGGRGRRRPAPPTASIFRWVSQPNPRCTMVQAPQMQPEAAQPWRLADGSVRFGLWGDVGATPLDFVVTEVTPPLNAFRKRRSFEQALSPPLAPPDLSYLDLRAEDCQSLQLQGANLARADLRNVWCTEADLTGADLRTVLADGLNADAATFTGAKLDGLDLTRWNADARPRLNGTEGQLTSLAGATVPMRLLGRDWSFIDLSHGFIPDLPKNLSRLVAKSAVLNRLTFTGCDLSGADFTDAFLRAATLDNTNLEGATFTRTHFGALGNDGVASINKAYIANASFVQAHLESVDLSSSTIFGAGTSFEGAWLENAVLASAYLEAVNFGGAHVRSAVFSQACLVGADFTGADLGPVPGGHGASFVDAWLHAAIFTGAHLDEVNMSGAFISTSRRICFVQYYRYNASGDGQPRLYPGDNDSVPVHAEATRGLDLSTLKLSTTCPNGVSVENNQKKGLNLEQMLVPLTPQRDRWTPK